MAKSKLLKEPKGSLDELYTTYAWGGTVRYQCSQCPMDFGSEELMLEHIDGAHSAKEPEMPPSGLVVADRHYNVVEPEKSKVLATVEITEEDIQGWIKK